MLTLLHRLTASPSTTWSGPVWSCSCGGVFTDPQRAAEHADGSPDGIRTA